MKKLILLSVALTSSTILCIGNNFTAKVNDKFTFAPRGAVEMNGTLGKYLKTSLEGNILVWDIDDLVKTFKERKETKLWQCEFWGKWYTSAELAYDFSPSPALDARLKYGAEELIKTQTPDGAITSYTKERELLENLDGTLGNNGTWDVWGRKSRI